MLVTQPIEGSLIPKAVGQASVLVELSSSAGRRSPSEPARGTNDSSAGIRQPQHRLLSLVSNPTTPVRLTTYGVWVGERTVTPGVASGLEEQGYGALWLGSANGEVLDGARVALEATKTLPVATGIVNIWTSPLGLPRRGVSCPVGICPGAAQASELEVEPSGPS